jgi:ribonuclease-3
LFLEYPDLSEGDLSYIRSQVVCEPTLAKRATKLNFGKYLLLGRGEKTSGGGTRVSILADAFEAVIGAVFLDAGFESAAKYVVENLKDDIVSAQSGNYYIGVNKDYKSLLQESLQKNGAVKIVYQLLEEKGPDHDKLFKTAVAVGAEHLGVGTGKSKKEAEQKAAQQALIKIGIIE